MPTNKEIFNAKMDALANSINTKAGTTGAKNLDDLKTAVDSISTGVTPTGNINITNTQQTDVTNYATAQVVDANLIASNIADGVTVLGITGTHSGGSQPQLYAPTISVSGRTLTITPNSNNGSFGSNFELYDGDTLIDTVAKSITTINLDDYFSAVGSHSLSVKMTGTDFQDSNATTAITYAVYSVSVTIIDGEATYDNTISNMETKVITLEADEGYALPNTVSVTGATSVYSKNAKTITLTNPTANVAVSVVCEEGYIDLEHASWSFISQISAAGQGANYFEVGDIKSVVLNGTVGTLALNNVTKYVYIIDFNHNSVLEGTGISFGCFKTAATGGTDVALCDSYYNKNASDTTKWFNMNHDSSSYNSGGWKSCDLRYDILGSVEVKDQQNATSAAITNPVANTLMAAFPSDLRAVLKPVTKYTDNVGGGSGSVEANVTSTVDYLFLLAEKEIFDSNVNANTYEGAKQTQYSYYASASKIKYNSNSTSTAAYWWERSPDASNSNYFCRVHIAGTAGHAFSYTSDGLSPVFVV